MNSVRQLLKRSHVRWAVVLLTLVCSAWQPEVARGQWTTSTSNSADIHNTNSGNVGIGTAAPNQKLSVRGMIAAYAQPWVMPSGVRGIFVFHNGSGGSIYTFDYISGVADPLFLSAQTHTLATYISGTPYTRLFVANDGNVGVGTTSPAARLHVAGDIVVDGNIAAKYQDVAEWVPSVQRLLAGTVVILDPERSNHVLASAESYDTKVAGVISDKPGLLLGDGGAGKVKVATTGRVRVRVDATKAVIKVGDLLVTGERAGYAMRSEPLLIQGRRMHAPGTIIGKALEPLASGTGEILVLLSLQ